MCGLSTERFRCFFFILLFSVFCNELRELVAIVILCIPLVTTLWKQGSCFHKISYGYTGCSEVLFSMVYGLFLDLLLQLHQLSREEQQQQQQQNLFVADHRI